MQLFQKLFYKPLSTQLTVTSSNGFHLRPVAKFVHRAKTFHSQVHATFKGKKVDATTVNTLLSLSLEEGDTFTLTTQGKDAKDSLNTLEALFQELMNTDKEVEKIQKETYTYVGTALEGDIICQGIVIASTFAYKTQEIMHTNTLSFKEAITQTIEKLLLKHEAEKSHSNEAEIYLAQKELLDSLSLKCESLEVLEALIVTESNKLKNTKLSAKISDYQDILQQVKTTLGLEIKLLFPKEDFILLADDLLPSEITQISKSTVQGVLLKETSIHSHTAILLRAAGIPSLVINTEPIPLGETIILDATAGVVILSPDKADIQKASTLQEKEKEAQALAADKRFEQARTPSGKTISVYANVGDEQSAKIAKEEGAEGIGLLRSEFLFKSIKPSLKQQTQAYEKILSLFDDITVRTLDVGGDKALPYINIPHENNPFLGIRGVRLFKSHPEILEEQLLAIFLASQNFLDKKIKIMFPMVSSVEEFIQVKNTALSIAQKETLNISHISFGIMIEVPSVLFLIEKFNEVVDFYSIGTNDLTQYLFATERTHPSLKVDILSDVVFTAIEMIVNKATKPVSICGELAANTDAIFKLIDIGIETLSMSPKSIAQTKEIIRHV
ncbi:MAG TPA: HPr family phosphocarrier protein [Sulfurovum sp.]|nr:HPr family phosphocarrier protein [Sulfurovum sp.]